MKKLLTAISAILLLGYTSISQNKSALISGKIIDDKGVAASSASLGLFNSKDSALVKALITNSNGEFEFQNIKPGKYFITVTSIGYKKHSTAVFELKESQSFFLAPITVAIDHTRLKYIDVQSNKPLIEVTADKTIFNIEGSINATGGNAFELLQKSPGVTIDKDDNISLKGKNGVRIYIDGKPSQMGGRDLSEFLKSINSADLESIELISNPSAKFDASGNAGIINLKLKKNKNYGTNGSISAGAGFGYYPKTNNSFTLNHRNERINVFGTYSNSFGKRRGTQNLYRIQNDTIYDQHTVNIVDPHIHNFKTGLDLLINKSNTIGVIVNGNFNNADYANSSFANILKSGQISLNKILYANGLQDIKRSNLIYNINYRFANSRGTELNLDADLGRYRSRATSLQPNVYKTPSGAIISERIYTNNTPTNIDIQTVKIDYTKLLNKIKVELGAKYSNVETQNIFDFYNVISGTNTLDSNRSNKFNYTENVNAGYLNLFSPLGKTWSIRAGVRVENTVSEGNLVSFHPQPDDDVLRNYTDFFPSGSLTHNLNNKNSFSLSYSRRIDRPNYADLNPFEDKIDELTYQKGNAFLRPQYTNIVELTHTYNSRFNTTLSYSHIKDYRTNIIDTTERNRVFRTVKNLASQDIINLNFTAPVPIAKWWNAFFTLNANRSYYKADFGLNKQIDLSVYTYSLNTQQSFTIADGLTFELSGFYNSLGIWGGTFKTDPFYNLDAGIQKTLFRKKGNLKVSYTDILKSQNFRGVSDFGGVYLDVSGRGESTQLRINFSYRFGNKNVKAARQRKAGLDEENKRIVN